MSDLQGWIIIAELAVLIAVVVGKGYTVER